MSSKLVKASNVVAKGGQKVISIPKPETIEEEGHPLSGIDSKKEELLLELEEQKRLAEQKLAEWQESEEAAVRLQLEEEKRRGYEEGYQLGFVDGTKHANEQYQLQLQKAANILEQAYQEKETIICEADPFIIELTMEIARKVVQQELKSDPDTLLHMIKQMLASVNETESISIGVAPEDFSFVQKQRKQLLVMDNGHLEIKVFPDYSIQQGGCIIRTSTGSVDARIDVQLSEIKKVLLAYQQGEMRE